MTRRAIGYAWRVVAVAAVLGLAGRAWADWTAGGYQDPATGKVWTGSYARQTGSWSTWAWAQQQAADYTSTDSSGTYTDWRVPTVAELQTAISDGTFGQLPLGYYGPTCLLWSSQWKGNKAWAVRITVDANGTVGGGQAVLVSKGDAYDVHFIRP
jgi:hypothetical protein